MGNLPRVAEVRDEGSLDEGRGEVMETLRGNLETFGLVDVVRLIASAGRVGVLKVESLRMKGRVFLADGAVTYATTRGEDGNVEELRGMTASPRKISRERRGRKSSHAGEQLEDLIEQQVVEVFVRLMRLERGSFQFVEGVRTKAYGASESGSFDVEDLIEQAEERIKEWKSIEAIVPSATTRFRLNPDLASGSFEVTLDARSWRFLAAVGDYASVADLAERLRIFEFPAAKKVAEFVEDGLLTASGASAEDGGDVAERLFAAGPPQHGAAPATVHRAVETPLGAGGGGESTGG